MKVLKWLHVMGVVGSSSMPSALTLLFTGTRNGLVRIVVVSYMYEQLVAIIFVSHTILCVIEFNLRCVYACRIYGEEHHDTGK